MAVLDSTNDIEVITVQVPALTTVITVSVPGVPGPASNLSIGTVTTGTAGATITGTPPNQVLNLTFPAGGGGGGTTPVIASTSTTSQAIAVASKVFTTVDTLSLVVGQPLRIWNTPTPANYMVGLITAISGTSVTVNVTEIGGSGTFTAWTLALTGFKGNTGSNGSNNTLSIGTVNTLTVGSSATASITGASPTQTLNLGLPTGATGANGPANSLSIGTVTTLAAGASATASITGTAPTQTLSLGIPAGNVGSPNTLTIGTVTTLAAGASATASVTGTAPNQTLNLGIPQGTQGTAGSGATDATTTAKGSIQLAGDLAGTAALPTVVSGANHTHTAAQVSNATTIGRTVLTAADGPAIRTAIGAGTSNLAVGTAVTDAKAGNYQPASTNISDSTAVGRSLIVATDATAARTAIGAGVGNVVGTGVGFIVQLTQAAFTALGTKDGSTLYVIVG